MSTKVIEKRETVSGKRKHRVSQKLQNLAATKFLPMEFIHEVEKLFQRRRYTPDEMENKEAEYRVYVATSGEPYMVTGFCVFADIDTETLKEYSVDKLYVGVTKRIYSTAEHYLNRYLVSGKPPIGALFLLKNHHGYQDKSEVYHNHQITMNDFMKKVDNTAEKQPELIEGEVVE